MDAGVKIGNKEKLGHGLFVIKFQRHNKSGNPDGLVIHFRNDARRYQSLLVTVIIGSGNGILQRIAIARALINRPQLLIADEPTSSLDQANRDAFMSLLMTIVKDNGITLLFVSHDMSLSNYFSRVEALSDINHLERGD